MQNLGYENEVVKVKNGYARNFLIPQGMAILATSTNKKILAEVNKQKSFKEHSIRSFLKSVLKPVLQVRFSVRLTQSRLLMPLKLNMVMKLINVKSLLTAIPSKNWVHTNQQ